MKDRGALIAYMKTCMAAEDWHAVSDAACDLRELDAEIRAKKKRRQPRKKGRR